MYNCLNGAIKFKAIDRLYTMLLNNLHVTITDNITVVSDVEVIILTAVFLQEYLLALNINNKYFAAYSQRDTKLYRDVDLILIKE